MAEPTLSTRLQTVLITGGAGFVGTNLAVSLRQSFPDCRIVAFDNLRRRGSELNLPKLQQAGVEFLHGDIRNWEDFEPVGQFDVLIDCAAEPSVLAGTKDSPRQVLNVNLLGTINCLERSRESGARVLFLSTSRVYPIARINSLPYEEETDRFRWRLEADDAGFSECGIREDFPLDGPRSFYGTSKLASELLLQEYHHAYEVPALINRCGVIAGPGQMGRVDQGVVTLWVAHHHYRKPLTYIGFGGTGKQVRDILHVQDLFELVLLQLQREDVWDGRVYNVGGGADSAVSLQQLTRLAEEATGHRIPIGSRPESHRFDVRLFITDSSRVRTELGWAPRRSPAEIVSEIHEWIAAEESVLRPILVPDA